MRFLSVYLSDINVRVIIRAVSFDWSIIGVIRNRWTQNLGATYGRPVMHQYPIVFGCPCKLPDRLCPPFIKRFGIGGIFLDVVDPNDTRYLWGLREAEVGNHSFDLFGQDNVWIVDIVWIPASCGVCVWVWDHTGSQANSY